MPAERYFLDQPLQLDDQIILQDQEFHHLARVMRARVGDSVELINGKGVLAHAEIQKLDKRYANLRIKEITVEEKPKFKLILAQAIPKLNRLEFILEKGTELGMSEIWLFPGKHSEKKDFTPQQNERLKGITVAAMKQCGRLHLPEIVLKGPLDKWKKPEFDSYFGDVSASAPLFSKIWSPDTDGVIFFVGPESGFTNAENEMLISLGAQGVKLHQNILRTDTASLVALSLIQHWMLSK